MTTVQRTASTCTTRNAMRRPLGAQSLSRVPTGARERVVVAARELVAEHGSGVTLSEIADRAAGGVNTDCRRWRRGLIDALLAQPLAELVALVNSPHAPDATGHAPDDDPPEWLVDLRADIPARLADRTASLPEIARGLAMSPRTLQRRLTQAGTSWRAEVEAARRGLAETLSANGARSDAIAVRLGYSDARALRRAVQRWKSRRSMST